MERVVETPVATLFSPVVVPCTRGAPVKRRVVTVWTVNGHVGFTLRLETIPVGVITGCNTVASPVFMVDIIGIWPVKGHGGTDPVVAVTVGIVAVRGSVGRPPTNCFLDQKLYM